MNGRIDNYYYEAFPVERARRFKGDLVARNCLEARSLAENVNDRDSGHWLPLDHVPRTPGEYLLRAGAMHRGFGHERGGGGRAVDISGRHAN